MRIHQSYIDNVVLFVTATKDLRNFFQWKKFILLIEDDIHFIHAPRRPTSSVTSTPWYTCTVLADIHWNIHAAPQNDDTKLNHWSSRVVMPDWAVKEWRGRIDIDHLFGHFRVKTAQIFFLQLLVFTTCWIWTSQFFKYPEHTWVFLEVLFALSDKVGRHLGKNGLNNP